MSLRARIVAAPRRRGLARPTVVTSPWRMAALCASLVAIVGPATAVVPAADRVAKAVAEKNIASGRGDAIRLELTMQIGDRKAVGTGEIVTHPTGLARLELRGAGGLLERQLLQGTEILASRNGERLDDWRFFLPPLFLLQAGSGDTLRAALESFGVRVDMIGLAPCDDADCLVIGDPQRNVPRPPFPPIRGVSNSGDTASGAPGDGEDAVRAGFSFSDGGSLDDLDAEDAGAAADSAPPDGPVSTIWIDNESYEVLRFESRSGVRIEFGPLAVFEKLQVPSWILIEEAEKLPVRFDVLRATSVNAPASAFSESWLDAPVIPPGNIGPPPPAR